MKLLDYVGPNFFNFLGDTPCQQQRKRQARKKPSSHIEKGKQL
jgi:hypothetical protein